ncbi:MAG: peptide ABC transporter substrate-binding protein [Treponemataceae bacterium]|nr:peptide ABC transporter substrate-binding protein [Treponemataceae bacterium]
MNKIPQLLLTGAALLMISTAAVCAQGAEHDYDGSAAELPPPGGPQAGEQIRPELQRTFTLIADAHPYNLNPHTASYSAEAQILTGLYEGLFIYDPITLHPNCALARSFTISRDKKRWTFRLRDDAKFSDGTPISAEDVKSSWLALLSEPEAPYSSLFDIIKGAQEFRTGGGSAQDVAIFAPDAETVSVHLKAPAAHFSKLLCMPAFSIVHADKAVASGPFYLAEQTDDGLLLRKNPYYYDAEAPHLEQISVRFSNDGDENAYLFNTGRADWISGPAEIAKLLSKDSIHLTAEFATEYLFFKVREEPPATPQPEGTREPPSGARVWRNAEFRAALLEAVPWDELRANTFVKAATLVYPLNGYPQVQGYVYTDRLEAEELMRQARQNAGIAADAEIPLVFATNGGERMKNEAELLRNAWAPLGVALEVLEIPPEAYLAGIAEADADLFSYTWIGDFADPLAFLELFRGGSTLNVSGWKNEAYDALLDSAALHTDEAHSKLLAQAEQLLLDDALVLPIQHPVSLNIIDLNAVGGWAANSFDIHPLKYLFRRETKPDIPNLVMHVPTAF